MSGDRDQEYFADGVTEDIITALSNCSPSAPMAQN
jgi:TolB-like protein